MAESEGGGGINRDGTRLMETVRNAFNDHFTPLFIGAICVGIILRLLSAYEPLKSFSEGLAEFCKESGNFILTVFLIAFLYENFVNYKNRQEFREEIKDLLDRRLGPGIHHVYERRPTTALKAAFIQSAHTEVIELGVALNRFKDYITGNMSTSDTSDGKGYRDVLESLMERGIHITCFAMDEEFAKTITEPANLSLKISNSVSQLREYIRSVEGKKFRGSIELHSYKTISHFAGIFVDPDDPENGKALISPYIPLRENNAAPVFEIHRRECEKVFLAYYSFVQALKQQATASETKRKE